jgi:hypothetical protein
MLTMTRSQHKEGKRQFYIFSFFLLFHLDFSLTDINMLFRQHQARNLHNVGRKKEEEKEG